MFASVLIETVSVSLAPGASVPLVALRLTPVLAGAALGRPMGFVAAWRSLAGRFLRFATVFAGLFIPLQIVAAIAWHLIVTVAVGVEEHLIFLIAPVELALYGLATTVSVGATLAVFRPRVAPESEAPPEARGEG